MRTFLRHRLDVSAPFELTWRNDDLQSFTPLRFMPPQLMGYRGRAVVKLSLAVDPRAPRSP